jgi:hypothetical protein
MKSTQSSLAIRAPFSRKYQRRPRCLRFNLQTAKTPPRQLHQAQTSSQATFESYAAQWVDYIFFRDSDLSTIGEESDEDASSLFDTLSEMDDDVAYLDDFSRVNHSVTLSSISHADDTLGLEGFSAVKNMLGLEGFSEVAV